MPEQDQAVSDQGLHCLPLTQQFYTRSQVVKWTCRRDVESNLSKISHVNEILSQSGVQSGGSIELLEPLFESSPEARSDRLGPSQSAYRFSS